MRGVATSVHYFWQSMKTFYLFQQVACYNDHCLESFTKRERTLISIIKRKRFRDFFENNQLDKRLGTTVAIWAECSEETISSLYHIDENLYLLYSSSEMNEEFRKELYRLLDSKKNIKSVIDIDQPFQLIPLLENNAFVSSSGEIGEWVKKLESLITESKLQLARVKQLHRDIVPLRKVKYKNGIVSAKYSAGSTPGGEFLDFMERGNVIWAVLCHTNSYSVSAQILDFIENARGKTDLSFDFLREQKSKIILSADEKMSFCFTAFDTINGHLELDHSSDFRVIPKITSQLKAGEKIWILSPGVMANSSTSQIDSVDKILIQENDVFETLTETFFILKKDSQSRFLKYDSTVLCFEFSKNALVKM